MLYVANKKSKLENIKKKYPNAVILDVTSTSEYPMARMLSPFYPHNNIPIPFTPIEQHTASCVEAVWQGLKVFQYHDVDITALRNDTMQNIKRTVRKYGRPLGHRKGVYGHELLNYYEARMMIYLPTYKWVLDNIPKAHEAAMRIKEKAKNCDIVLLDYNTNEDFQDISALLQMSEEATRLNSMLQRIWMTIQKASVFAENIRKISEKNVLSLRKCILNLSGIASIMKIQ